MRNRAVLVTILITVLCVLILLLSAVNVMAARATSLAQTHVPFADQRDAVQAAVDWLITSHQNDDGGFASFSIGAGQAPSDVPGTLDVIIAIAASGHNPAARYPGKDNAPLAYLNDNIEAVAAYTHQDGGAAGKLILALVAANQDPRDFGSHNFIVSLTNHLSPTGQYNVNTAFNQSLAILALASVSETVPLAATQWLLAQQAGDGDLAGSWDDGFGTAGNPDSTAMAIMALTASGRPPTDTNLVQAREFLARTQLDSGGWEYGPGFGENANSTALVVQALSALGEDFYTPGGAWDQNGNTPLTALMAWQSESGAFQADFGGGRSDDFFTSIQAIPAVTGKPFPLPGRYEAARLALTCLDALQDATTGGWDEFAGSGPNAGGTSRAIQAITAVGENPTAGRWTVDSVDAVQALENLTPDYLVSGRGGRVGIIMQGVTAAGGDVADFAGYNLVISMTNYLSAMGEYDDTGFGPFAHARAMLGLLAAGIEPDPRSVDWLANAHDDGDWGGPDSSGIAVNVLSRLNRPLPDGALANLSALQEADGGWGYGFASPNSTSEVVQGLVSAGQNPFDPTWSRVVSGTVTSPANVVMEQQLANGCWPNLYGPGDDPFATTDAILLLMQHPVWPAASEIAFAAETPAQTATETAVPTEAATATATAVARDTAEPAATAVAAVPTPEVAVAATPAPDVAAAPGAGALPYIFVIVVALLVVAAAVWMVRGRRV